MSDETRVRIWGLAFPADQKPRTFRDDGRPCCPKCGEPVVGFVLVDGEPVTARCGNGHEWEPPKGEKTLRM